MRISKFRAAALALVSLSVIATAGCASRGPRGDTPYVARDVGTLYSAGKLRLDRHDYKMAAALFDEVERQHPYSIWARRAQIMGAFSYYLDRDYTNAIQSAQRFLSVHPGNRDAPYAYYLIALSYYEQINDVTRDQKISQQALDALGELTRRYPNTRYASDARLKIDLVRDHLAGKEMEIGRFYERRGQWLAASMRFRVVVDQFQTTTHTPEALMRLTETYLALGVHDEAKKSAAVLGANYPGTNWYEHAYKLMNEHPVSTLPPTPYAVPAAPPETPKKVIPSVKVVGDDEPVSGPQPKAPAPAPTPTPAPAPTPTPTPTPQS
jgi:outer membrane protein assembly factor BamD